MPLTDLQIRKAKPADRPIKLTDGGGLHLFIAPTGSKTWRLRYEIAGKEKLLTIGAYPEIGLEAAREARAAQKKLLRSGKDPSAEKRRGRSLVAAADDVTFEYFAKKWHTANETHWSPDHAIDIMRSFENDVFADIGARDVREITPAEVLATLRKVEDRSAVDTAKRIRQRMSAVFVYAIASGVAESDPAAVVLKAMRAAPKGRQPAIVDLKAARSILAATDDAPAYPATKLAMRLLALTALRPGCLTQTPWAELDGVCTKQPLWTIPAERMKLKLDDKSDQRRSHIVPLSRQALEVIDALRSLTGRGRFVFPNARNFSKPISENALGYMLNRAGYHGRHVPHGWRAAFSTIMNEKFRGDRQVIDMMLAHVQKDRVEAAYNRAEHIERRAELAQIWADLILEGRRPAEDLLSGPRHG